MPRHCVATLAAADEEPPRAGQMLLCTTETRDRTTIDRFVATLGGMTA